MVLAAGILTDLEADWQACCLSVRMDDIAYDISHLLASDTGSPGADPTAMRSRQFQQAAAKRRRQLTVAEAQDALSRELMGTAEIHDALVQQYLHTTQNPFQDI